MSSAVNTIRKAVTNPAGAIGGMAGVGLGGLGLNGSLGGIGGAMAGGLAGAQLGNIAGNAFGMQQKPGASGGGGNNDYGSFIQNMAMGNGPSAAQTQLQQGLGSALANAQSFAASQRGVSPALAARMAMQQQSAMQHQTNIGAALLRSQEQMNATGMWGNYLTGQQNNALARDQMQGQKDIAHSNQNTAILGGLLQGGGALLGMGGKTGGGGNAIPNNYQNNSIGGGGGMTASPYGYNKGGPVKGDSPKNDTVPAMLSPGEIVLPRSVTQGPNMEKKAIEFLRSLKADKAKKMWRGGKCGG